jgi:two-component system, cell cycle response regulator
MTTDQAYAALKNHPDLPSPKGAAMEIMRLARSDNCRLSDLARIVESDPALASRLIKLVNSPAFPHGRPVVSLTEAIAYLGTRMVVSMALGFSLVSTRGGCRLFDYVGFWSTSLARAVAGCRIAQGLACYVPDEVFTVGLLAQLGRLVLATIHPDRYGTLIASICCSQRELIELERELFDIDHNDLTARLMADWGLPSRVCDAVYLQYETGTPGFDLQTDPGRLASVLAAATMVAEHIVYGTREEGAPEELMEHASRLGVATSMLPDLIGDVIPHWREMVGIFDLDELGDIEIKAIYAEAANLRAAITSQESA